jgi:L-ascorbate metabolism protein UlaG (beta-lactamase superfamily)
LDITWFGHSCFRIKGKEVTVVTDPCSPDTGFSYNKIKADLVTISHSHPGHSYRDGLDGEFREIKSPGEYELKGVFITGIASFHDENGGSEKGKNNIFLIEIEGVTFCHLGDIGHLPATQVEEELGEVGVLFVPVGGVSTIDGTKAATLVRSLSPKVVIPMHYKTPQATHELESVDKFLKNFSTKDIVPQPKLTVNKSNLPLTTQIVLLEVQHR